MNSKSRDLIIKTISFENYKSLRSVKLNPNKFNIFLGDANSGKSNLLEALSFVTCVTNYPNSLPLFIRFSSLSNLFFDDLFDNEIEFRINEHKFSMKYENNTFLFEGEGLHSSYDFNGINTGGSGSSLPGNINDLLRKIKFYRYDKNNLNISHSFSDYLLPVDGRNLFSVIFNNKDSRGLLSEFLLPFGLQPVFKPQNREIELQKLVKDIIINLPYQLASETLRAMIFYLFLLESNKNSVLVFEEPESHTFPYYTKYLAELIADDMTNQYFIATHNQYFLNPILEKAPENEVNVYITYMDNYETKLKLLTAKEKQELLEFDPFLNLKSFLGENTS